MESDQAKTLCRLFGTNPDEAIGEEPRYIAVQRVFDSKAADNARKLHDEHWSKPRPPIASTGTRAKGLQTSRNKAPTQPNKRSTPPPTTPTT